MEHNDVVVAKSDPTKFGRVLRVIPLINAAAIRWIDGTVGIVPNSLVRVHIEHEGHSTRVDSGVVPDTIPMWMMEKADPLSDPLSDQGADDDPGLRPYNWDAEGYPDDWNLA